jgi:hypothetical protein
MKMIAIASSALIVLAGIAIPNQVRADRWDNVIGGLATGAFVSNYYNPQPYRGNDHGFYANKYGQSHNGSQRYRYGDTHHYDEQKPPYGPPYKNWTEF